MVACLYIPLILIVFIWAIVAVIENNGIPGCASLFWGAWVFIALMIILNVIEFIMMCCCKRFFIKENDSPVEFKINTK